MKNFQVNLFIVLAIALCGLCVFQWREATVQRGAIQSLNQMVYERNTAIQGYTNSIATLNHQVDEMDGRITDLKGVVATNEQTIASQKVDIFQLHFSNAFLTNEVAQYKTAVDALEAKLKDAYAGIEKQNEAITNLVAQRDQLVGKYNDEVKDRNAVVAKYNELAKQVEQNQSINPNQ